jgi:hypothetical protein
MRPDMAKLLTEAERYGSWKPSRKWGKRLKYDPNSDYEDEVVGRAKMSRNQDHTKLGGKDLSDVLNPLKGYLRANLGRSWDKIYSELSQNLDRRSVSGQHVFQHIWDYVAKNCWIGEGKPNKVYELFRNDPVLVDGFYIHPFTGLLREQRLPSRKAEKAARKAKEPITSIKISATERYEKFDGIWFYLNNYKVEHEATTTIFSYYLREVSPRIEFEDENGDKKTLYTYKWTERFDVKRQLNGKELKKLGLENEIKEPRPLSRRESRRLTKDLM